MATKSQQVLELETEVRRNAALYFNNTPEITDAEFDAMVDELRNLDPDSEVLNEVGAMPSYGKKVAHPSVMGSLDKATTIDEILAWHKKYGPRTRMLSVTPKIDGIAVRLVYKDGVLVESATRGDGKIGMDVTDNIRAIKSIPKFVKGFSGEVRGEIYMKRSVFDRLQSVAGTKSFANPRNAAGGSLMAKDPAITAERDLSLLVYDMPISKHFNLESEKYAYMVMTLGKHFDIVEMQMVNADRFAAAAAHWDLRRPNLDFQIDGLVAALDYLHDQTEAGWNGNKPRGKIAFKFKPAQARARVVGIDWEVGRTGRLTPMCRIEPTQLDGSTISNITLHNAKRVRDLRLDIGDYVLFCKAGDIIPAIIRNLSDSV